jgi:hypothetical protein
MMPPVQTQERLDALRAAVAAAPGSDVEALCAAMPGVHRSSVFTMLAFLKGEGLLYRRRPHRRTLWFAASGVDLLTQLYTPDVSQLKVSESRVVESTCAIYRDRAPRGAPRGLQSSLSGSFHVGARTTRHGGAD